MSETPIDRSVTLPVIDWRLRQQEEATRTLRHWRGNTDMKLVGLEGKIELLHTEITDLRAAVDKMNRRLGWFTLSFAGGCLTFAFTVLTATGKI